ncbi:hypothetical protein GCM10009743_45620 [Kribbella swartbergensis]
MFITVRANHVEEAIHSSVKGINILRAAEVDAYPQEMAHHSINRLTRHPVNDLHRAIEGNEFVFGQVSVTDVHLARLRVIARGAHRTPDNRQSLSSCHVSGPAGATGGAESANTSAKHLERRSSCVNL